MNQAGRAISIRADAGIVPLADESVDLIVTSPPYYALRSYTDGGEHYDGQIGSEASYGEFLDALWGCTAEWMRVLRPGGSIFVNLGDKYATRWSSRSEGWGLHHDRERDSRGGRNTTGVREKSLLGLPWRYAIGCIDDLGLILRAEIIWSKVTGLPESVTDRVRRAHEQLFHFVKAPRYFAAVDEIREPHSAGTHRGRTRSVGSASGNGVAHRTFAGNTDEFNPLGRLPGSVWDLTRDRPSLRALLADVARGVISPDEAEAILLAADLAEACGEVWEIPSAPLTVPACRLVWDGRTVRWFMTWDEGHAFMRGLARDRRRWKGREGRPTLRPEIDHFAAFPPALVRPIILGFSPAGICLECGEGRWPVPVRGQIWTGRVNSGRAKRQLADGIGLSRGYNAAGYPHTVSQTTIAGYACACTPYTDHPERRRQSVTPGRLLGRDSDGNNVRAAAVGTRHHGNNWPAREPTRDYHFDRWTPPPTRPAVVYDPFGGAGTTAVVAAVNGRLGISGDLSHDYGRLARWRTSDRAQRARALGVAKPRPTAAGQLSFFGGDAA